MCSSEREGNHLSCAQNLTKPSVGQALHRHVYLHGCGSPINGCTGPQLVIRRGDVGSTIESRCCLDGRKCNREAALMSMWWDKLKSATFAKEQRSLLANSLHAGIVENSEWHISSMQLRKHCLSSSPTQFTFLIFPSFPQGIQGDVHSPSPSEPTHTTCLFWRTDCNGFRFS